MSIPAEYEPTQNLALSLTNDSSIQFYIFSSIQFYSVNKRYHRKDILHFITLNLVFRFGVSLDQVMEAYMTPESGSLFKHVFLFN